VDALNRHLGTVTNGEWDELHDVIADWLFQHRIAGSILDDYSLYAAMDAERDQAAQLVRDRAQAREAVQEAPPVTITWRQ
jgi:hypothetical protein